MLNSNLVDVNSFARVRTSKHLLPKCNTQQPKDRYYGQSREVLYVTSTKCTKYSTWVLAYFKDFTHSSNWCNVSFLLYDPIKWDYKWRDRQITCMFLYASLSYKWGTLRVTSTATWHAGTLQSSSAEKSNRESKEIEAPLVLAGYFTTDHFNSIMYYVHFPIRHWSLTCTLSH